MRQGGKAPMSRQINQSMDLRIKFEDRLILVDPKICLNFDGEFSKFQLLKLMTNTTLKVLRSKNSGQTSEFVKVTGGANNKRGNKKRKQNNSKNTSILDSLGCQPKCSTADFIRITKCQITHRPSQNHKIVLSLNLSLRCRN